MWRVGIGYSRHEDHWETKDKFFSTKEKAMDYIKLIHAEVINEGSLEAPLYQLPSWIENYITVTEVEIDTDIKPFDLT